MRHLITTFLLMCTIFSNAQSKKETALEKAQQAIVHVDLEEYDEGIKLLEESCKLDPENAVYPYEIAYAHVMQKNYKEAIKILKKTKKYDSATSQTYQLLGNTYDYSGDSKKALEAYNEGLERFPNAGNLHLEKGNIYYQQENYDEAILNYKNGVKAAPMFPSNYYHLGYLYMHSTDKLSGLIYGELFMNLERTTERTIEISELMYNIYKEAVSIEDENHSSVDFCEPVIKIDNYSADTPDLPFCLIFAKNFILGTVGETKVDLNSIAAMRTKFIENYYVQDAEKYPNVLFSYHKLLLDNDLFDAYSHYLLQMGNSDEFNSWKENHPLKYNQFETWYIKSENEMTITKENLFVN